MALQKNNIRCDYDLDDIRNYMSLSVVEKLERLGKLYAFYCAVTPEKSKKIWNKLKSTGKV